MRAPILLALALSLPAQADDEHRPLPPPPPIVPWMTGAQLLQKLSSPSDAAAAEEYIKGVHDATDRTEWCYMGPNGKPLAKPRPADLQAQVRTMLAALPTAQLRRPAARLIVRAWQEKWPCPPDGCCDE